MSLAAPIVETSLILLDELDEQAELDPSLMLSLAKLIAMSKVVLIKCV